MGQLTASNFETILIQIFLYFLKCIKLVFNKLIHSSPSKENIVYLPLFKIIEMTEFISKRLPNVKNDVLSGITVALALVPEAVAFAFVAGVDPLVGLYAAFMVGLITSIFGGRPGMISGATGALAVVMVSLVARGNDMGAPGENLGLYYLFATVILMGFIQIMAGVLKLGKVRQVNTTSCDDGFCKWFGHRDFFISTWHVQGNYRWRKGLVAGNGIIFNDRFGGPYHADDVGIAQVQSGPLNYLKLYWRSLPFQQLLYFLILMWQRLVPLSEMEEAKD